MEEKVEYILKIINEDGDSFSVRAEMYYRKRPELINFVEDCFRGYRALAERYDHLSKDLQNANRTIATVYPERVQLSTDDDDEYFPAIPTPFEEPKKPPKNALPPPPVYNIPRSPSIQKKIFRSPTKLMSRKGLLKIGFPDDAKATTNKSGLTKIEAFPEIDRLQKEILARQTEKEFLKSSYENGIAKYWEIEKEITDMQAKVSCLQDEFDIETVIEDDEARTVMAATALNSCQEKLANLQNTQEQSIEEAKLESKRVKDVRERFETMIEQLNKGNLEEEMHDLSLLKVNMKEQLLVNASVTITELGEKIDELVDTVISLESSVSSQNALVKRIVSENDELQAKLQRLEVDKETLKEGSYSTINKVRELEEELCRLQSLHQSVDEKNKNLQNLDYLSEKFPNVEGVDKVENMVSFGEVRADMVSPFNDYFVLPNPSELFVDLPQDFSVKPKEKVQNMNSSQKASAISVGEDLGSRDNFEYSETKLDRKKYVEQGMHVKEEKDYFVQPNLSNPVKGFEEFEDIMARSQDSMASNHGKMDEIVSMISKDVKMGEETGEEKKDATRNKASFTNVGEENFIRSNRKSFENLSGDVVFKNAIQMENQLGVPDKIIERGFKDDESLMAPDNSSLLSMEMKTDEKEKERNNLDDLSGKSRELNKQENDEKLFFTGTVDSEFGTDEEDQPNWRELFLNGLEDREKLLMNEYTSVLRSFKQVKKKLSESEKKHRANLFKSTVQIKVLRNANASKDAEIQSLHKKLDLFEKGEDEVPEAQKEVSDLFEEERSESTESPKIAKDSSNEEESHEMKVNNVVDEVPVISTIQEKIRMDIDDLLEENIEFWLRYSTSFHQVHKFHTTFEDLQVELSKLRENKEEQHGHIRPSDVRPIYKHLRDIQTELSLWLEQNGVLEDDLKHRLSSISSIQEEISRLSIDGSDETELTDQQAARFTGEIMNMKQENNKVADELVVGIQRVKRLKIQIEILVAKLDEEFGISASNIHQSRNSRRRIPLRSFLFGVKLKKQKASLFSCLSPALQRQYSDLHSLPPTHI